jgi:recombination protein RecR
MEYPSRTIENAVKELSRLPGVGKKTALRLAMHLLRRPEAEANSLSEAIRELRMNTQYCHTCHNISDDVLCNICASPKRDASIICVVEDTRDVMALENTHQFQGLYHVLGGIIHPLEGISPAQLNIETLIRRCEQTEVRELIFAFSASMEGETTAFYIARKINRPDLRISSIAKGISVGSELEFTDEITLARSLLNRIAYSTGQTQQLPG